MLMRHLLPHTPPQETCTAGLMGCACAVAHLAGSPASDVQTRDMVCCCVCDQLFLAWWYVHVLQTMYLVHLHQAFKTGDMVCLHVCNKLLLAGWCVMQLVQLLPLLQPHTRMIDFACMYVTSCS